MAGGMVEMSNPLNQWQGEQLRLRPFTEKDRDRTLVWRNNPQLRDEQLGYPFPVTSTMEGRWFSRIMGGEENNQVTFAIEEKKAQTLIGYISLTEIDWIAGTAQFSITIGETQFQRRGFGKESTDLMLDYAFQVLNLRRIWLRVVHTNKRAIHLYEKAGFEHEGTLRKHVFRQGNYHDLLLMGRFRSDPAESRVKESN
jgi:RimJ/RimL family protein N-acetyltransferase